MSCRAFKGAERKASWRPQISRGYSDRCTAQWRPKSKYDSNMYCVYCYTYYVTSLTVGYNVSFGPA